MVATDATAQSKKDVTSEDSTMNLPVNAEQMLSGNLRGKDKAFLLMTFDAASNTLTVKPDYPVALNIKAEDRDRLNLKLPTRNEFSKGQAGSAYDSYRTGASGAALWVYGTTAGGNGPRILLLQNSLDKPVNPGRFNFPSGLLTSGIMEQAFIETNEESGLLIVDRARQTLTGINLNLFPQKSSLTAEFRNAVFAVRSTQEDNIRKQLSAKYPEFSGWAIEWKTLDVNEIRTGAQATLDMMGSIEKVAAHVVDDRKAKSVNLHFPVSLTLPDTAEVIVVDPEKFGRNAGLYTLDQARQLDTIPAPHDYLHQKLVP